MRDDFLTEILKLSVDERLRLIDAIWESIASDDAVPMDAERRMFEDRIEAHRRAPETSVPWEDVKARLESL